MGQGLATVEDTTGSKSSGAEAPKGEVQDVPVMDSALIPAMEDEQFSEDMQTRGSDCALPPCLALQAEAEASTADVSASELSSRSSYNPPPGLQSPPAEIEDEKAVDRDADLEKELGQGCAALTGVPNVDDVEPEISEKEVQRSCKTAEESLSRLLSHMDLHLRQLRVMQQWLVQTVEMACRVALGKNFKTLTLVGSVALCVETPGSDVDVVCFTHPNSSRSTIGNSLRLIRETLKNMMSHPPFAVVGFSLTLIEDARVPILRVYLGPVGQGLAVDVLVDQRRPLDHVHWFQRIGAVPSPSAVTSTGAPPVMMTTVALRCVKWWLRRRQLPPTREGGLPTLAWLLLALHSCNSVDPSLTQMSQLIASLSAFFHSYAEFGGLHGTLVFEGDDGQSTFTQRSRKKQSPWSELSVLDPTLKDNDNSELVPKLLPATQLLFAYEFRRASSLLREAPEDFIRRMYNPVEEDSNSLPSSVSSNIGAIMLLCDPSKGVGTLQLVYISEVCAHSDWKASFLHRSDTRSEIYVRLLDLDLATGHCQAQKKGGARTMVLCPCHFVCRVRIEKQHKNRQVLKSEDLERFKDMQQYLRELHDYHEQQQVETETADVAEQCPGER